MKFRLVHVDLRGPRGNVWFEIALTPLTAGHRWSRMWDVRDDYDAYYVAEAAADSIGEETLGEVIWIQESDKEGNFENAVTYFRCEGFITEGMNT